MNPLELDPILRWARSKNLRSNQAWGSLNLTLLQQIIVAAKHGLRLVPYAFFYPFLIITFSFY